MIGVPWRLRGAFKCDGGVYQCIPPLFIASLFPIRYNQIGFMGGTGRRFSVYDGGVYQCIPFPFFNSLLPVPITTTQTSLPIGFVPLIIEDIFAGDLTFAKAIGKAYEQNENIKEGGPNPYIGFTCRHRLLLLPLVVGFGCSSFPGRDLGC